MSIIILYQHDLNQGHCSLYTTEATEQSLTLQPIQAFDLFLRRFFLDFDVYIFYILTNYNDQIKPSNQSRTI